MSHSISRRDLLKYAGLGTLGVFLGGMVPKLFGAEEKADSSPQDHTLPRPSKASNMQIQYAVSLWNFSHYGGGGAYEGRRPTLEDTINTLRKLGYGIELWASWTKDNDLAEKRLKNILQGMKVSLHGTADKTFEFHKKQIDGAVDIGAGVIVLHCEHLVSGDDLAAKRYVPDLELMQKACDYAAEKGVRLALENGWSSPFEEAIEEVDGLGICLDVGHVYLSSDRAYLSSHPIAKYLNAFKERIIHLHLQDILTDPERGLPFTGTDHFIPGTGGIPTSDWQLLITKLGEFGFRGMGVFEIRPRNPFQTALLAKAFMEGLMKQQ